MFTPAKRHKTLPWQAHPPGWVCYDHVVPFMGCQPFACNIKQTIDRPINAGKCTSLLSWSIYARHHP